MYNQPALRFLVLADFIIDRSLFVLDTPAIMGSRQTAGSVPAPRVEAPSHGSHVTALIAFLAVTGREYHCPHCLSSPFRVLPINHRKTVCRSVPESVILCWETVFSPIIGIISSQPSEKYFANRRKILAGFKFVVYTKPIKMKARCFK